LLHLFSIGEQTPQGGLIKKIWQMATICEEWRRWKFAIWHMAIWQYGSFFFARNAPNTHSRHTKKRKLLILSRK
jgi:hypothetical protein